ncbi:hypothetical protein ALC56_09314 [Trachymyrmex septentrionalis]|uniref:Uncharacterized protein n=1 Tax=Trachymyrmex septentrionalis TaxID=34720 RepID=A0A195F8G8_9HYME|nr:hypothetical protein ALC56_09314 [Trachymyrmex septentrionalis]
MQNYRAGPVGPVGARGVPRGIGGGTSGRREVKRETRQEGPAAPQPTSTLGLVKLQVVSSSITINLLTTIADLVALPPDAYVHMHVIFFVIQAKHGTMINLRDDWQKKKEKRERTSFGRLPPQRVQSDVGGVLLDLPSTLQDPRPSIQGYESQLKSLFIDGNIKHITVLNGLITFDTISYNTTVSETEAPSSYASIISSDFQHQRCQLCPNEYITRSVRTTPKLSRSLSKGIKKRREGTGAGVS